MKSRHRGLAASSVPTACVSRSHRCGASTLRLLRDRRLLHGLQREKESKGITPPRRAKCCSCNRRDALALRGHDRTRCGNRTPRETRTARRCRHQLSITDTHEHMQMNARIHATLYRRKLDLRRSRPPAAVAFPSAARRRACPCEHSAAEIECNRRKRAPLPIAPVAELFGVLC